MACVVTAETSNRANLFPHFLFGRAFPATHETILRRRRNHFRRPRKRRETDARQHQAPSIKGGLAMASTIHRAAIVAAIALISTSAHAGPSRSLSLADAQPNEKPALDEKPAAPASVERPKIVAPEAQTKPSGPAQKTTTIQKPRRRQVSTEARIIYELHRHGIYW
jgi:hypothetical protein